MTNDNLATRDCDCDSVELERLERLAVDLEKAWTELCEEIWAPAPRDMPLKLHLRHAELTRNMGAKVRAASSALRSALDAF